jgi:hypothetical protein
MQPFSCLEKAFYFRRSNAARNWRRNNFKVTFKISVPSFKDQRGVYENIITYDDFYLHWENLGDRSCEPDSEPDGEPESETVSKIQTWQFVWADLLGQDGLQVGSLTRRPLGSQIDGVLAASSKVTF